MKSTIRIKTINGKEYWYEDIPYYDKEKKQIRHRSKYLGKNIDGKPVQVRSEPMIPASAGRRCPGRCLHPWEPSAAPEDHPGTVDPVNA